MKGIYKSFKSIMFVGKERDLEIGHPTEVKHVAHIGWGSSGSDPGWMSDFKAGAEFLSPRTSSFSHTRHSDSFFTTSDSTEFDQDQLNISDRIRDVPPIPVGLSKIHTKSKNRRKKPSSTSSPRSRPSPKSSRSMGLSKSSHKSMVSRLNSNA
jgi:hypothetical protein